MGTAVTVSLWVDQIDAHLKSRVRRAFRVFRDLDAQFSLFKPDSEISRVNQSAGTSIDVTDRFATTLERALDLAKLSHGFFSPFATHVAGDVLITRSNAGTNVMLPTGTSLDLNALVKGMALDLARACFAESTTVLIEAGGDIVVNGEAPEGGWKIGIRNPNAPEKLITVLPLEQAAVCTSGTYFRGEHIRKPEDALVGSISMTVVAPTAEEADALSTAVYHMPIPQAFAFVESFQETGALAIDQDGQAFLSPRLRQVFQKHLCV